MTQACPVVVDSDPRGAARQRAVRASIPLGRMKTPEPESCEALFCVVGERRPSYSNKERASAG